MCMTYRVAFAKRTQSDGNPSDIEPAPELESFLADGVVADKRFVERLESEAQHSQEVLDEDDAFLGLASAEVWEYDVVDGHQQEFEDALRNSEVVMEFDVIDETSTGADEVTTVNLASGSDRAPEDPPAPEGASRSRATDEEAGELGDDAADLEVLKGTSSRLGLNRESK